MIVDVLQYQIGIDTKRLRADVAQVDNSISNMAGSIKKTLVGVASALGIGFAAFQLKDIVKQLGEFATQCTFTAGRTEELKIVLENVGRVSGLSSSYLAQQEKAIKDLGITTIEARTTLIRFMQAQIDVSYATKIARVAQDLAVIAGLNTADAVQQITDAIAAQRPMLLRQFGIVSDLTDVY